MNVDSLWNITYYHREPAILPKITDYIIDTFSGESVPIWRASSGSSVWEDRHLLDLQDTMVSNK